MNTIPFFWSITSTELLQPSFMLIDSLTSVSRTNLCPPKQYLPPSYSITPNNRNPLDCWSLAIKSFPWLQDVIIRNAVQPAACDLASSCGHTGAPYPDPFIKCRRADRKRFWNVQQASRSRPLSHEERKYMLNRLLIQMADSIAYSYIEDLHSRQVGNIC